MNTAQPRHPGRGGGVDDRVRFRVADVAALADRLR